MTQIYEAIYENGLFRPLASLATELTEGQRVRLVVETDPASDILALAAQVYAGLSEKQVDAVEEIALDGKLVIAPVKTRPTLEERMASVTKETLHGEIDFGLPEGNEVW